GRVKEPQRRAAFFAEIPLARAGLAVAAVLVADLGTVDADGAPALHLQAARQRAEIDGIAAAARRLAADAAVAELVGNGRVAVDGECDRSAAAGSFQTHRHA